MPGILEPTTKIQVRFSLVYPRAGLEFHWCPELAVDEAMDVEYQTRQGWIGFEEVVMETGQRQFENFVPPGRRGEWEDPEIILLDHRSGIHSNIDSTNFERRMAIYQDNPRTYVIHLAYKPRRGQHPFGGAPFPTLDQPKEYPRIVTNGTDNSH